VKLRSLQCGNGDGFMSELAFYRDLFLLVILAASSCLGAYIGMRVTLTVAIRREQRERAARLAERQAKEWRFAEALRIQREADYAEMRGIEDALARRVVLGENPLLIDRDTFLRYFELQHGAMPYVEAPRFHGFGDMRFVRRDTGESVPIRLAA
jgi:hypothetical protein